MESSCVASSTNVQASSSNDIYKNTALTACIPRMYLPSIGPCLPINSLTMRFCDSLESLTASTSGEKRAPEGKKPNLRIIAYKFLIL